MLHTATATGLCIRDANPSRTREFSQCCDATVPPEVAGAAGARARPPRVRMAALSRDDAVGSVVAA